MKGGTRRILKAFGARVRTARRGRKLTQAELAKKLTISVAYMSLIERGGRNPPYTTALHIAETLQTTLDELSTPEVKS